MDAIELMMLEIAVKLAEEHHRVSVEIARRTLVDCWQSFKSSPGDHWGIARTKGFSPSGKEIVPVTAIGTIEGWQSLPQRILEASPYLQGYDAADLPWDKIERLKRERDWNVIEALDYLGL